MGFEPRPKVKDLHERLQAVIDESVCPAEQNSEQQVREVAHTTDPIPNFANGPMGFTASASLARRPIHLFSPPLWSRGRQRPGLITEHAKPNAAPGCPLRLWEGAGAVLYGSVLASVRAD